MSTTIIRTSTISTTGYELVVIDELGTETVQPIQSTYKNEPYTLVLPENPAGRKYMNSKKVDASGGEIELVAINRNPDAERTSHLSKKKMVELMTDEERELYNTTIANAEAIIKGIFDAVAARNTKTLTPEEKLRARIAKLEAKLAAMDNEGQA